MFDKLNDLYQQIILDHYQKPRNFHELTHPTYSTQKHNPLYDNQLNLFLQIKKNIVKDIGFMDSGCYISKTSASLLTEHAKGKSRDQLRKTFDQIHEMVTTNQINNNVDKLTMFTKVHKFP